MVNHIEDSTAEMTIEKPPLVELEITVPEAITSTVREIPKARQTFQNQIYLSLNDTSYSGIIVEPIY